MNQQYQGRRGGRRFKQRDRGEYVEVDQRVLEFYQAYPEGRLTSSVHPLTRINGYEVQERSVQADDGSMTKRQIPVLTGVVVIEAKAYRTADDPVPGVGHSWLIMPGRTPYTLGSELENAETSAWGRAIASTGIAVREGIATREEIVAREVATPAAAAAAAAQAAPVADDAPPVNGEARDGVDTATDTPEAGEPAPVSGEAVPGLSFEEFIERCRESFIPAPVITKHARELFGDEASSIRGLSNTERERLWAVLGEALSSAKNEQQTQTGESTPS